MTAAELGTAHAEAIRAIPCACPVCHCPAAGGVAYSFRYVDEDRGCLYFDVPKAASSTIRAKLGIGKLPHPTSLVDPARPRTAYFAFTVVRNPWDRMVSNWRMFTTKPLRKRQLRAMTDRDLTAFADFVAFALETPNHHWVPQVNFVPEDVDFTGRIEDMATTFATLAKRIPYFDPTDEKVNVTAGSGADYRPHYTDALADTVGAFYAADVARFGYRF